MESLEKINEQLSRAFSGYRTLEMPSEFRNQVQSLPALNATASGLLLKARR